MNSQIQSRLIRASVVLVATTLVMAACTRKNTDDKNEVSTAAVKPLTHALDSVAVRAAEEVLRHYLDASREGSATHDSLQFLTACGDGPNESYFPTTMLAGYSLMPSDMHGDTVVGRAAVVSVAEQDVDRRTKKFTARQRVREDVLEWDIVPLDDNKHWAVCNGLRFGYLGADSLTTWRPDGASYITARALVDSIVKARGN